MLLGMKRVVTQYHPGSDPDSSTASHLSDSVIYCAKTEPGFFTDDGQLRLLGPSGAPSLEGVGRLEIYQAGSATWSAVCRDGFTASMGGFIFITVL